MNEVADPNECTDYRRTLEYVYGDEPTDPPLCHACEKKRLEAALEAQLAARDAEWEELKAWLALRREHTGLTTIEMARLEAARKKEGT